MRVFVTQIILFISRLILAEGIQCIECGFLEMLPGSTEKCKTIQAHNPIPCKPKDCFDDPDNRTNSYGSDESKILQESKMGECNYELGGNLELGTLGRFIDYLKPHDEQNKALSAVCYNLTGNFRGNEIVMRGCDVVDSSQIGCRDKLDVWFETERGREYITVNRFCTCTNYLCNGEPPTCPPDPDCESDAGTKVLLEPYLFVTLILSFLF